MDQVVVSVLVAAAVVAGIGLLIGLILSVASMLMAVPKNQTAEAITQALPGANCGACGFSGCAGYAEALSKGEAQIGLCTPGGDQTANEISVILGVESKGVEKKIAVVKCMGSFDHTEYKADYAGIKSCTAASKIGGGLTACAYGCLGFGDCESVCDYGAIKVCNGVAVVDEEKCVACEKCVKACPRGIIALSPKKRMATVRCANRDKGGVTRKLCRAGCIGCKKCEKACPVEAVKVENFLAYVDTKKCIGCKKCVKECPRGCITYFNG